MVWTVTQSHTVALDIYIYEVQKNPNIFDIIGLVSSYFLIFVPQCLFLCVFLLCEVSNPSILRIVKGFAVMTA